MGEHGDYVARNRRHWDRWAREYEGPGRRRWSEKEPSWGEWGVPESQLRILPDDIAGWDVVELGCGTGYISAWLARLGARPVGIDNSEAQLETARRLQREFGLEFPLVHGNAEDVPAPYASFDLAISEYGASIWCDPYCWIPEAARLLRPGGQLIFMVNGTLLMLCSADNSDAPVSDRLERDYFGMHRFEWSDNSSVDFHLGYGDWIRLLRANGFEIENLIELRPDGEPVTHHPEVVTLEWSRRWPCEEIWKARKR